jgi:hypothetical protein
MARPITPRVQKVDNLKDLKKFIGKIVSDNIFPTLRGKLVSFDRDLSTFEVYEADEDGPIKYNTAVGQTFQVPTYMTMSMNFID